MHLADRGTGQRLLIKLAEHCRIREGAAERTLAIPVAHRRHPVVQLTQRLKVIRVKKIGAGGKHLRQFEKTGAEGADILNQVLWTERLPDQPAPPSSEEQENRDQKPEDRITALRSTEIYGNKESADQATCPFPVSAFPDHLWSPDPIQQRSL